MRVDRYKTIAKTWHGLRAALVIAHPGHELRLHHWLERAQPVTFVLTDGSGHTGHSRLASTTALLRRAGARRSTVYGPLSDQELYRALLSGERDIFDRLVDVLADALHREDIDYVVGDAIEGFNPGHDVCRLLLNAAVSRLERKGCGHIINMEFPVEAPPDECPPEDRTAAIILHLDEDAFLRKMEAARAYSELAFEIERVLYSHGQAAFRIECIRPVHYGLQIGHRFLHPCAYEVYGAKQVAAGIYRDVIRYRDHIAPLAVHLESLLPH